MTSNNSIVHYRKAPFNVIYKLTAIVPIIKNKTEDSSDKNNYRPITLEAACSKIFEICLLEMLEQYLHTNDQFGFIKKHSTVMCIFTVKSKIKYYTKQKSSVHTYFFDEANAFYRVSHWTLFSKLIK